MSPGLPAIRSTRVRANSESMTMRDFTYRGLPAHVVFGRGTLTQLAELTRDLGWRRALLLSTPAQLGQVQELRATLGEVAVGVFAEAAMHTPVEISERAVTEARQTEADCVIALGGGSTIGLAKAIALRTDLPQIVVPTTYAGSEMTPILGQTEAGRKTTQRTLKVLPEAVLYDVEQHFPCRHRSRPAAVSTPSRMPSKDCMPATAIRSFR